MMRESAGNQWAARYEPRWKYWVDPERYANELHCTSETERMGQATSYGYMQIMGSVARELGFTDWFGKLYQADYNVSLGAAHLARLIYRYKEPRDVISAYNAGSPRKTPDGRLVNSAYVDGVMKFYWSLKQ